MPDLALSVAVTLRFVLGILFMVFLAMEDHPNLRRMRRR